MNPLDLTGPDFLKLYLGLLVVAVATAMVLRRLLRVPSSGPDLESVELDPYEVAYLAGGRDQAADAAITTLVHRGALTVNSAGRTIEAKGPLPSGLHALELAVAPQAETGTDPEFQKPQRTIEAARRAASPALESTRDHLVMLGLLMDQQAAWSARLLSTLPLVSLLLLGLMKIQVGLARGKPVSLLSLLGVATVAIAIGVAWSCPNRSRWGDRLLNHLRRRNSALGATGSKRAAELASPDLALAVALFGTGILAGGPLNDLRTVLIPPPSSGGGDSGSSCGGGCGGGGCGGCGSS